jgi:hypothetical protein
MFTLVPLCNRGVNTQAAFDWTLAAVRRFPKSDYNAANVKTLRNGTLSSSKCK